MGYHHYRGDNPRSAGQLYDLLQSWFGFGTWDESDIAWWEARNVEIAKLKKLITSRRTSVQQLHTTAKWCRDNNVALRGPAGLFLHMGEALKADANARSQAKADEVNAGIAEAIEFEREHHPGEDRWLGQLLRAQDDKSRREVLHRWKLGRRQYGKP